MPQRFSGSIQKCLNTHTHTQKDWQIELHQNLKFLFIKNTIKKVKLEATEWMRFASYVTKIGISSRIYEEVQQINMKNTDNPVE